MAKVDNLFNIDPILHISGINFPIMSIQISTSFNTYPRATISIAPDARMYGISRNDRVPVQVFIRNVFVEDTHHILVFEGEIESFGYSSTTMGRNVVINAVHTMAFFEDVNLKLISTLSEHAASHTPGAQFAHDTVKSAPEQFMPLSLFMKGINAVSDTNIIEYPRQFITNIVSYIEDESKNTNNAMHQYYSKLSKEWSTGSRIAVVPFFDDNQAGWNLTGAGSNAFPLLKALQSKKAIEQLSGRARSGPHQGNVFEFINYIFSMMEYELGVPNSPTLSGGTLNSLIAKPMFYDALPPACNIIFRSEIQEISARESIKGVPTRIRVEDISSAISNLIQGDDSALAKFAVMNFYPAAGNSATPGSNDPMVIEQLLPIEEHFGPLVYDTQSPPWLGYVNNKFFGEDTKAFMLQLMEHLYLLKRYEKRNMTVTTPYNPYITAGYPGVVFDAKDTKFTFIGQVLSVGHVISKTSMSTTVEMGFVRLLEDDSKEPVLIPNSVKQVSNTVTHSKANMDILYKNLLGCANGAIDLDTLKGMADTPQDLQYDYHNNPTEAYKFNERKIVTLEEYVSFINSTLDTETGDISGPRFDASARYNSSIIDDLYRIRLDLAAHTIY